MSRHDVAQLGQVFTPPAVVRAMLALRRNRGRVLEPSCGDGAFLHELPGAVGIEADARHCPPGALHLDFFAYPEREQFDTIIGNPPYVRFQDIAADTRARLDLGLLDARANLYLFFIEKCVRHLAPGGELIFITPRDFLKTTAAVHLNRWMQQQGSLTEVVELGDARVFDGALPNCLIWRFERGRQARAVRYAEIGAGDALAALETLAWEPREQVEAGGHLLFCRGHYPLQLRQIFFVKVGAVSGADDLYASEAYGNREFVCSSTERTGHTRRMLWVEPDDPPPRVLRPHKERLIARRVTSFDENNWWHWGRGYYQSDRPRIYVNGRTRHKQPFFLHRCLHYDGAVLALFPLDPQADVSALRDALNAVDWADLGFVCDGRHLFSQRSLEHALLPESFSRFLPNPRDVRLPESMRAARGRAAQNGNTMGGTLITTAGRDGA